jgi:hypothetical protein
VGKPVGAAVGKPVGAAVGATVGKPVWLQRTRAGVSARSSTADGGEGELLLPLLPLLRLPLLVLLLLLLVLLPHMLHKSYLLLRHLSQLL